MSDVTRLLDAVGHDDPHAAAQLLPLVYDELRRLAAHRLAHEAPGVACPRAERPMNEVTCLLSAIEHGEPRAAEQLLPLVYDELRRLAAHWLAHEKPGQTLQATALVHEAYVRLVDSETIQRWDSRGHFFAAAATAMRRILVEQARRRRRLRHGGGLQRIDLLDRELAAGSTDDEQILLLDEALDRVGADQPQIRLMDQRRGLKRLAGLLLGQLPGRQFAKLFINQREQLSGGLAVAPIDGREYTAHFVHEGRPPGPIRSRHGPDPSRSAVAPTRPGPDRHDGADDRASG